MRKACRVVQLTSVALLTLTWPIAAGAQQPSPPSPQPQSADPAPGEIVVTAEKRSSTVQKVPLSITAVTGAQLQALGISSAQGVVKAVPGISVASAGPGQAKYQIRGLSSDGGEAATVGFYLDDVPITPPATATTGKSPIDPNLYDLARVEVLRGPQGTLYGASSLGGTVKLIPAAPDAGKFYGSGEITGSGTQVGAGNAKGSAMLNIPLVEDRLAFRITGTYAHDSGWIDRVVVPNFPNSPDGGATRGNVLGVPGSKTISNVNDSDIYTMRAALLVKPSEELTITPSIFYQKTRQGGMNTYDSVPGPPHFAHYQAFDISEPYTDRFVVGTLPIVYDFGPVSLTSVTSYWERLTTQKQDSTEQLVINLGLPGFEQADGGPGPSYAFETDKTHQFSQEVRLASNGNGPIHWLIGGFYSDFFDRFHLKSAPPGTEAEFGSPVLYDVTQPLRVRQKAVFANIIWNLTDKLKLEGGARYFSYSSRFGSSAFGALYDPVTPIQSSTRAKAHGVTPMANLSYQVTPQVMVYGQASKGFREGAGNFPVITTGPAGEVCLANLNAIGLSAAPTSFKPDTVWNFEVGEKARFAGNRITINSDIYLINWNKVQTPVALACGLGFTTNGPKAQVKGGELEAQFEISSQLHLSQSVGYADGKYTQDFVPSGIVDGQPLLNSPHWTLSTTIRYEYPLDDRMKIVAIARNNYTSKSRDLSYKINQIPSRDDLALRLGAETKAWSAYLFVENLLNQHRALENINTLSFTGPPYNRVAMMRPRTAGLDVNFKF